MGVLVLGVSISVAHAAAASSSPVATTTPLIIASTDARGVRASTAAEVRERETEREEARPIPTKPSMAQPSARAPLHPHLHNTQFATHDFDDVVSGVVSRALGGRQPHAVADAVLAADDASAPDVVVVVLGHALRSTDLLRNGDTTAASLTTLVREAGSAAVLPHMRHGHAGGGCRAKAAARMREAAAAAAADTQALIFGCGGDAGDAAASASEAAAALAAAGWAPETSSSSAPLLLIACTPETAVADAEADAQAMARAHAELLLATGAGAAGGERRVLSLLAVRPPAPLAEQRQGDGRRRLQQQLDDVQAAGGQFTEGAVARGGGGGDDSGGGSGGGGAGSAGLCDVRCQSQVKWLQGIIASAVMLTATAGGLASLGALQGPSVFAKPSEA
jgi:hypothetical protein